MSRSWSLIIFLTITSCSAHNIQLIKDYTKANDITVVLLVSCEGENNFFEIETTRKLQLHGLWTNIWDISSEVDFFNFDFYQFFNRYSNSPGVVMNLGCNQTKALMTEMSNRTFFHRERKWLMLSESLDEAFGHLNQENINYDAEIMLAVPSTVEDDDHYDIFDVYNPSHRRGGRLNITLMGYWSNDFGWNEMVSQTKIE